MVRQCPAERAHGSDSSTSATGSSAANAFSMRAMSTSPSPARTGLMFIPLSRMCAFAVADGPLLSTTHCFPACLVFIACPTALNIRNSAARSVVFTTVENREFLFHLLLNEMDKQTLRNKEEVGPRKL